MKTLSAIKSTKSNSQRDERSSCELCCRNNESKIAAFPEVQEGIWGSQSPTSKGSYLTAACLGRLGKGTCSPSQGFYSETAPNQSLWSFHRKLGRWGRFWKCKVLVHISSLHLSPGWGFLLPRSEESGAESSCKVVLCMKAFLYLCAASYGARKTEIKKGK